MQVFINDHLQTIDSSDVSIAGLLPSLGLEAAKGIAIAVNGNVISKNEWKEYLLQENDQLIIIKATQGG